MSPAGAVCTLEQHQQQVGAVLAALIQPDADSEVLAITDAGLVGRVVARGETAALPSPVFDNSQMDGFAVCAGDLAAASATSPVSLSLGITTAAGDPPVVHRPGTASPVMTGAVIPSGADAVVPVEDTVSGSFPLLHRASESTVGSGSATFTSHVAVGSFVRREGEDRPAGAVVLSPGDRLTPARIGAAAAAGLTALAVRPRVRVLLCTTGDEVGGADLGAREGSVPDANGPMLRAAFSDAGADVTLVHTPDDVATLHATLQQRAQAFDLVITTGGISAGAYEVVREALAPLGFDFHSVAIQPGGPQGYGVLPSADRRIPVVCFPGNPVSSLLSAELFVLPILREIAGLPPQRTARRLPLAHDVSSPAHKHQLRRGTLDAAGRVTVSAPGSHLIHDLAAADVIVHLPIGTTHAPAGENVLTWSLND